MSVVNGTLNVYGIDNLHVAAGSNCRCDARSQRQDHRPLGCGKSFLTDAATRSLIPLMRVSETKMKGTNE
jgi:hypothetical protein